MIALTIQQTLPQLPINAAKDFTKQRYVTNCYEKF